MEKNANQFDSDTSDKVVIAVVIALAIFASIVIILFKVFILK